MATEAALIAAGASLTGDVMAQRGAQATNATNIGLMRTADRFNAEQASVNRMFQAGQVDEMENYQTHMADTQMQRRVADLRLAGLNPALAYQLGGAQSPSGGAASGSGAASVGVPQLQNPNLGFGQLGQQVSSAMQTAADVNLKNAQANKANQEAGVQLPAVVDNIKSQTHLNDTQAANVQRAIALADISLKPYGSGSNQTSIAQESLEADNALKALRVSIGQMDYQEQQATLQLAIKAKNDTNFAASIGAENLANASSGAWGKFMSYLSLMGPAATSAAKVGTDAVGAALAP